MSCGCGGAPPWHPSTTYGAGQNQDALEFAANPVRVRGGGEAQPGRAPASSTRDDGLPWHVWLILVITVITFMRGRDG